MTDDLKKPKLEVVSPEGQEAHPPIQKPGEFNLNRFKSTRASALASVETQQTALPHHSISQAKDFVRLHPDEEKFWSDELCFVSVPIKGQKQDTLHLILEALAMRFLPPARIQRFRLALATKPYDVFFLCSVPTRNEENSWNSSNRQACEQAKRLWTMATSRKEEGIEGYKIDAARNQEAFPEPKWPTQSFGLFDRSDVRRAHDRGRTQPRPPSADR